MKNRNGVWIFSHDGFWFVGIGRGYYNRPLAKLEAIEQARQLARRNNEASRAPVPINIFDDEGELIDQIV